MVEVRLFAGLCQGRQKMHHMELGTVKCVQDILDALNIQRKEEKDEAIALKTEA